MSKQARANEMFNDYKNAVANRKEMISYFVEMLGVSEGYASTLYANARKANAKGGSTTKSKKSTSVQRFNKENVTMFRDELTEALASIEKKFGVTVNLGGIRYGDSKFSTRVTVSIGSADESAKREWDLNCWRFNLKPEQFGSTFVHFPHGTRYTVTGLKPKSRKYPILAQNANGTTYKFPASVVSPTE